MEFFSFFKKGQNTCNREKLIRVVVPLEAALISPAPGLRLFTPRGHLSLGYQWLCPLGPHTQGAACVSISQEKYEEGRSGF